MALAWQLLALFPDMPRKDVVEALTENDLDLARAEEWLHHREIARLLGM